MGFPRISQGLLRFSHQALDILFENSIPITTAWNTYPDCVLYKYDPYMDRKMIMTSTGSLKDGTQINRRGIPLLMVNQVRQKK